MKRVPTFLMMGLMTVALGTAGRQAIGGQDLTLHWHTVDGGGVMHNIEGDIALSGTIGQPDAGNMSNGALELTGGFWFPLAPGDCNTDGCVNLFDHADWIDCASGPQIRLSGGCACFDLDNDADVDLFDAAEFQIHFDGN